MSREHPSAIPTLRIMLSAGRVAIATGMASAILAVVAVVTARACGPAGRGTVVLVSTVATYVMLVISLGIPIPARVMMGSGNPIPVLRSYLGLGTALCGVQILISLFLIRLVLLGSGVSTSPAQDMLCAVYSGALMAAFLLTHALYGVGSSQLAALVQVAGASAQVLLVTLLAASHVGSPWPYVTAMLAGNVCQVCLSLLILAKRGFSLLPELVIRRWLVFVMKGLPAIGLTLGQAAVLRFDRILIGLFLAASAVGIYSVAATATELVWLLPVGLAQVLFHAFASRSIEVSAAKRAHLTSLGVAVITAVLLFLIAPVAVSWLVGSQFSNAVTPMRILLIGAVLFSSYQLDSYTLASHGQIGVAAIATLVGFGAMFLVDLAIIPSFGIVGASWASVFAYGLMAVISRALVIRMRPEASVLAMDTPSV